MTNVKKVYGRFYTTQDLMTVYKLQLFDHSEWINLDDGTFEEKLTGAKQDLKHLYPYINRGLNIKNQVVCARKFRSVKKFNPIKSVRWINKY